MKKNRVRERLIAVFFFAGLFAGILFVNLWGNTYLNGNGLLSAETFRALVQTPVDERALFFYLVRQRGGVFLLFWLLGYTVAGIPAACLLLAWLGFSAGVFLSIFIIHVRLLGILLFLAAVLPQALLYVPYVYLLAAGICDRGMLRYKKREVFAGWKDEKPYVCTMLLCLALLLAGIILESRMNLWLMRKTINYFL